MTKKAPMLTNVFYVLAGLSLIGGIIISSKLHPGEPEYGYTWKMVAYMPMSIAFTAGFVQASLFTAIGKIICYLSEIESNTRNKNESTNLNANQSSQPTAYGGG